MEDRRGVGNSTPSFENIKVHAVDAEPVIDKVFSFTITFGIKKSTQRWRVTHSFARFKVLDMFLRKYAPKCIYSRFPKDGSLSILGIRRKKDLESRRLMLDIWIREVVANSELFPEDIQLNLWDFMRVPAKISAILQPRPSLARHTSSRARNTTPGGDNDMDSIDSTISTSPSSELHGKMRRSHRMARQQVRRWVPTTVAPPVAPRKKSIPERMIRTVRRKLINLTRAVVTALCRLAVSTGPEGTVAVCLGRNELLLGGRSPAFSGAGAAQPPLQDAFLSQIADHAVTFVLIALATAALECIAGRLVCARYGECPSTTLKVLVASAVMYAHLLCLDFDRLDGETARGQPSYLHVQEALRAFLDSPTLEYSDEAHPFPSAEEGSDTDDEADVWRDVGGLSDDTHAHGNGLHDPHPFVSVSGNTSPHNGNRSGNGLGTSAMTAVAGSRKVFGMSTSTMKKIPPKLHETLVPGSSFDKCEFVDVSKEARAMYTCRAETHPLKVRGETYLDDQKKIAAGPAMSRLMLLELYEVEAKDGDRHDHVVSRGKAKQRLEALRTLPEKLFFFVLNIQLPGDPPISIVSYFAMPLDLMDRYPGRATAKFLEMFEKFADAPRSERERQAAWGIALVPEVPAPAAAAVAALSAADSVAKGGDDDEVRQDGDGDATSATTRAAEALDGLVASTCTGTSDGSEDHRDVSGHGHSRSQDNGDNNSSISLSAMLPQPHGAAAAKSPPARDPIPEHQHSSALSKISQAKKIVREAAALGGGGLRRMGNYIIGHHSHDHEATLDAAAGAATSPDAAHASSSSSSIIMRLRSNSDGRDKRRDGQQGEGRGLQMTATTTHKSSTLSAADELLAHALAPDNAGVKDASGDNALGDGSSTLPPTKRKTTKSGGGSSSSSGDGQPLPAGDDDDDERPEAPKAASADPSRGGRAVTPPGTSPTSSSSSGSGIAAVAGGGAGGTGVAELAPLTIPAATAAAPAARGSAWLPSDIVWPNAYDVGALPPSDYRNERFKLIPSITEGPWVVRAAVRATPAMLGKKVVQRYFRGEDYLEVDVHVGSSVIASNIVGVCRGYAKHMVNDCGVVIQGECAAELPERMLACVSLNNIDVNIRMKLDD